ncbi:hypothetical protein CPB85DRAFT_1309984 [Mucidula mucida]|nr:hypothetical protein CPB85DRAFT_1309984 [Mucidula mucida]
MAIDQTPSEVQPASSADGAGQSAPNWAQASDSNRPKYDTYQRGRGRGRGRGGMSRNSESSGPRKEWHEEWKDLEDYIHPGGYNPNIPVTDRVRSAALDFARNRMWPREFDPNASMTVREQWDQFLIFIGIIMNMPIWHRVVEGAPEEDDEADFSDEEMNVIRRDDFRGQNLKKPLKPRPPYANYAKTPTVVQSDKEIQDLLQIADSEKNEKLFDFCDNPEKMTTIFLSSYMIDQSLIYSDRFLFTIPRLVRFFLIYLLKNDVLDGRADELKKSLKVADLAIVELLQTSKLAKALPDALHNALSASFSSKVTPEEDAFAKSLQEQGVEFVSIDVEIAAVKDAVDDNVGTEDSGWGVPTTDWKLPEGKTLSTLLGPTAPILALTHTSDIVESSTRQFSKVVLSPWPDARVNHPVIEETSKGHVLAADKDSAPGAHDPWKDDIVILVEDETAAVLKVGMGLEGTFVQIVRRDGDKGEEALWYLSRLLATLPSYYLFSGEVVEPHPDC